MPAIGITGGVATGKTAFGLLLREIRPDAVFFDADRAARELTDHDSAVRASIAQTFGSSVYSAEGHLNREELRAIVFADPGKKHALEQVLHPRIRRQWARQAESRRGSTELFLADIPLLYETAGDALCDCVVVVACSPCVQLARLMARSSLNRTAAEQMIAAQMPLQAKIARADHLVWNNGTLPMLREQAATLAAYWSKN